MDILQINDIRIVLTDNKVRYQSGDYICGKVVISVNGRIKVSVININLDCIAEVKWTELPGFKSEGHNIHVKRKYLEYVYQLPEECMLLFSFVIIIYLLMNLFNYSFR